MIPAEHADVVQTFAAHRTNQPFDIRRRPRGARRNPEFLQTQCQSACLKFEPVAAVPIAEQVFRRRRERKGLAQLLGRPTGRGAVDDLEVKHSASTMRQDDQDVKDLESEGGDGEEVDGNHPVEVIAKKGLPVGRRWAARARDHVFGNASLGNVEPELEQFPVDSRSTPQRIGAAHLPDQLDGLWAHRLAPGFTGSAFPAPKAPEPGPVPLDDSARLNQTGAALPICP